jgi:hypothetical protein
MGLNEIGWRLITVDAGEDNIVTKMLFLCQQL